MSFFQLAAPSLTLTIKSTFAGRMWCGQACLFRYAQRGLDGSVQVGIRVVEDGHKAARPMEVTAIALLCVHCFLLLI